MPFYGDPLLKPADLKNLLEVSLDSKPDEIALLCSSRAWTWRELQRDIDTLAERLAAKGFRQGERFASLMPNQGEMLIFLLSCIKLGLVAVPLNYRYTSAEIDRALEVSGAVALCVDEELREDIRSNKSVSGLSKGILIFESALENTWNFESLVDSGLPAVGPPSSDLEDCAFLFFTSGSTGEPKGVIHSQFSFGSIVASFAIALNLSRNDVVLPGASIAHVGSLSTAMAAFSVGAMVVIPQSFEGPEILSLLRSCRPTVLVMIPAAFISMERNHDAKREDFASLRLCVTGGDKFPLNLAVEFVRKTGLMIQETYGLTEAPDCLFNPSSSIEKAGSVGKVSPGYIACLRDGEGREVAPDTDGNLWLSGAPVMAGYWANSGVTRTVLENDWFDTGDIMRVDSHGYFWFRGRKKQIIVRDGSNLSPQEIEEAVMAHPAVDLAGVVGVHNDVHGEDVWAFITLKSGVTAPSVEDVIDCARERVGYKAPEVIIILDSMPLNPTGKIDRAALKKLAEEQLSIIQKK
ncbi:class I adenylate-forming enzyme family protein [Microbulbifer sp. THAF38]|uniref:class I adenylate-forming enzyme family protein n=1 Tax=Microbulbifer sp. THAF38 TaxID=2587856 RepID=UPI0012A91B76|nr:class I adenylate-forming enzyme family protein [Microbulbifer sp. THAF38]QFT54640.1 Long-chain-fatty-acid--CoA ligase [Microbulbifer sp. THAF38]